MFGRRYSAKFIARRFSEDGEIVYRISNEKGNGNGNYDLKVQARDTVEKICSHTYSPTPQRFVLVQITIQKGSLFDKGFSRCDIYATNKVTLDKLLE